MKVNLNVEYTTYDKKLGSETGTFTCEGEMKEISGKKYIRYTEPKEHGGGSVIIKEGGGKVSISRKSESSSHFEFERGKVHLSRYFTPYGNFLVSVKTHIFSVRHRECEERIKLLYELIFSTDDIENVSAEKYMNDFFIRYTEIK